MRSADRPSCCPGALFFHVVLTPAPAPPGRESPSRTKGERVYAILFWARPPETLQPIRRANPPRCKSSPGRDRGRPPPYAPYLGRTSTIIRPCSTVVVPGAVPPLASGLPPSRGLGQNAPGDRLCSPRPLFCPAKKKKKKTVRVASSRPLPRPGCCSPSPSSHSSVLSPPRPHSRPGPGAGFLPAAPALRGLNRTCAPSLLPAMAEAAAGSKCGLVVPMICQATFRLAPAAGAHLFSPLQKPIASAKSPSSARLFQHAWSVCHVLPFPGSNTSHPLPASNFMTLVCPSSSYPPPSLPPHSLPISFSVHTVPDAFPRKSAYYGFFSSPNRPSAAPPSLSLPSFCPHACSISPPPTPRRREAQ